MTADRGAAAIELAIAFLLILGIALGTYEFGTAFADKTAMANAVREGARAGSAAGEFDESGRDADCVVIEASAGALQGMDGNAVTGLWIYETDSTGELDLTSDYQHYVPDDDEVDLTCGGGNWNRLVDGWPPSERELGSEQWLGVKVTVDREWKTGFGVWNGTVTWEETAVMRLEPENPNS